MNLLKKIQMKQITPKTTKRALRYRNSNKALLTTSNYGFIVG